MNDAFLGSVVMFAGNYAPKDWAFCHGQLMNIAPNGALFSLLGTSYGGDGKTTFALPDLRGAAPEGMKYGNGEPFNYPAAATGSKVQRTIALNYIICLSGRYPSR